MITESDRGSAVAIYLWSHLPRTCLSRSLFGKLIVIFSTSPSLHSIMPGIMNAVLRCNRQQQDGICRRELRQEAYVTTCSYVTTFCLLQHFLTSAGTYFVKSVFRNSSSPIRLEAADIVLPAILRCQLLKMLYGRNFDPKRTTLALFFAALIQQRSLTVLTKLWHFGIIKCAQRCEFLRFVHIHLLTGVSAWQEHIVQRWANKYNGLRSNASKVIEEANGEIADLQRQVNCMALLIFRSKVTNCSQL